jgi:serine/threonine-protein phosphatase 2A regulatory subunit A
MGDALGPVILGSRVFPTLNQFSTDKVPNIRFNVAKALERLGALVDAPTQTAAVRPILARLATDEEPDVRYYAQRALKAM